MYNRPNRQAKFEAFIDSQQAREQANWFRSLEDQILPNLVIAINQAKAALDGTDKADGFEQRTATKLRESYKELRVIIRDRARRDYNTYLDSRRLVEGMVSQINSWFRSTKVACGIKGEIDGRCYGKAAIYAKFDLLISDSFEVTANQSRL